VTNLAIITHQRDIAIAERDRLASTLRAVMATLSTTAESPERKAIHDNARAVLFEAGYAPTETDAMRQAGEAWLKGRGQR
jgi:hypothetical protein